MFCENCGTKLEDGVNICPNCGKAIGMQPIPPTFSHSTQQNTQQNFQGQQFNYSQPVSPVPNRNIRFTPEEQKALKSGCNAVGFTYLGYAIFCSLCALIFLVFSIMCISDPYYYGASSTIFSVAGFLDFAGALIVFYIKFAEFRKYAKCVDGDTSIIINKFRGYSIALGIVVSILFFWPAIIPVILTSSKVSDPLKRMTAGLY